MSTLLDADAGAPTVFAPPPLSRPAAATPEAPPVPERWADLGLGREAVADLALKTLYAQGAQAGQRLAELLAIPFGLLDEVLLPLQQRRMVEVRSAGGHARPAYVFDLSGPGRERAREALAQSGYVGPAPVPLAAYAAWSERQSVRQVRLTRARMEEGLGHIVLPPAVIDTLGPAINSARSVFLHGDPGNGKTLLAQAAADLMGGAVYVPHAIDVDGYTVLLHDPVFHVPADEPETDAPTHALWRAERAEFDRRWARVRRPVITTGGELTLDQLELQHDGEARVFLAPVQMKANGGVLILEDFGRQRVPPRDLLNRWIVPLELHRDYLAIPGGRKFPVPFDCLLIITTNLPPRALVDEAFLRRIHYKIRLEDPTPEQYREIFRRCCAERGVAYRDAGPEYVYREVYARGTHPRACHPRDILDHLCDAAAFLELDAELSEPLMARACGSYFLPGEA